MKQQTVQKILFQTTATYNNIVEDFNKTRSYLWPGLRQLGGYVKPGDKVLDLGCGNGKLRLLFKDVKVEYTGVDNSIELLKLAESRKDFEIPNQKFIKADAFALPFADNTFDSVFFIAVFHHLPGKELRRQALAEIRRVLKPGGYLLMTNWNRYQKENVRYVIKYTWLKIIGQTDLDFKDIYLPWMGGKAERYYHAFTLSELRRLIAGSGLKIQQNYLAKFDGTRVNRVNYFTAANLVTIAKK